MKRRKAIGRIVLIGGGTVAAFSGYKWYQLAKSPDIPYLLQKKELIASLADAIIPATGKPGAKDAGVEDYILLTLEVCTDRKTQNRFIDELKSLEQYTTAAYHTDFSHCSAAQQQQVLDYFREKDRVQKGFVGKVRNKFLGRSFFSTLRNYTIEGFCSSQKGVTQALSYTQIPGKYIGCMPLQPGQTSWATN